MKKFLLFVVALGFLASSCSSYTCATYAKQTTDNEHQTVNEQHI
ncbi:hypothetical protein [Fulvivirga sediminis]|nr:hypothetical protein [Fulvivirga sediminis]